MRCSSVADRLAHLPDVLVTTGGIRIAATSAAATRRTSAAAPLASGIGLGSCSPIFSYNVMQRFREATGKTGVQVVCCRRSTCALQQAPIANGFAPRRIARGAARRRAPVMLSVIAC